MDSGKQARLDPRLRLRLGVDVTPGWQGARRVRMEIFDLSTNGAALVSPIYLPLKTQVSIELKLPPLPNLAAFELKCEAVVVNIEEIGHERKNWRAGLFFLNLNHIEHSLLRRFVFGALAAIDGQDSVDAAHGSGSLR